MNAKREYVHQALESGCICVFPTEVSARHYLADYALHGKAGAILSSQAISFDTFKALFLPHHPDLKPSNDLARLLFVRSLLDEKHVLSYFANPEFPESNNRFSSYVAKILPHLEQAMDEGVVLLMESQMRSDIKLLYQLYTQFLAEHQLFEPRFELPSIPEGWDGSKQYCILFSDTIAEAEPFLVSLGSPSWVTLSPAPEQTSDSPVLHVYSNHVQEIHSTMRLLRDLLEDGVRAHDILLGLAGDSAFVTEVEQAAWLYGVPLAVREGKDPNQYPSGRFLSRLYEVYQDQFSLESMKSLLLDIGIPWRDADKHRKLLAAAVKASILQGSLDARDPWLIQLKDFELKSWYKKFKQSVVGLCQAQDMEDLRRKLNSFQDDFLVDAQWKGTEGEDVYSFCLATLEKLSGALGDCSIGRLEGLYSFYLEYLKTKLYVPQQTEGGIAVYLWPQVATLGSVHQFVLGLDQQSCTCLDKPLFFLPDTVEEEQRKQIDTTEAMLRSVCLGGAEVVLSCHTKSYSGEVLPPSYFIERQLISEMEQGDGLDKDPYLAEQLLYLNSAQKGHPTERQVAWYEGARKRSLAFRSVDYTYSAIPTSLVPVLKEAYKGEQVLSLSPTKIDLFARCPYAWLCHYLYHLSPEDFDVLAVDHLRIGNLLHKVYQRSFEQIRTFDASKIESYRTMMLSIFDETLEYYYGKEGPTPSIRSWIIATYREKCTAILDAEPGFFANTTSIEFEKPLDAQVGNLLLNGKIDRILAFDDNHYGVIDYKKGEAPSMAKGKYSYQLPLYQLLVKEVLGAQTSIGAYYSVKNAEYVSLWTESKEAEAYGQTLEEMLGYLEQAVEAGKFMATPSKEHCPSCDYRSMCRRRFATR